MMMMTMHLPWPHRPRGGRRWADRDAEASDLHLNEIEIHSANSLRIDRFCPCTVAQGSGVVDGWPGGTPSGPSAATPGGGVG